MLFNVFLIAPSAVLSILLHVRLIILLVTRRALIGTSSILLHVLLVAATGILAGTFAALSCIVFHVFLIVTRVPSVLLHVLLVIASLAGTTSFMARFRVRWCGRDEGQEQGCNDSAAHHTSLYVRLTGRESTNTPETNV